MHSGLEILSFLQKQLFLMIYNNFHFDFVNLLKFSFQAILILKKDILVCNAKAYGLAI